MGMGPVYVLTISARLPRIAASGAGNGAVYHFVMSDRFSFRIYFLFFSLKYFFPLLTYGNLEE